MTMLGMLSDGTVVNKPRSSLTDAERILATANEKALNAIYCALKPEQFMLISTCLTAKEARDALETIYYKETNTDRLSKLGKLRTQFEELKMGDDETIEMFNTKLIDIANQSFHLGEKYSDEKLVTKTLRSLPHRFEAMVVAIEQLRDVPSMKFDEIMGSLRAYELNYAMQRKDRLLALKAENTDSGNFSLDEDIAYFMKKFGRPLLLSSLFQNQSSNY